MTAEGGVRGREGEKGMKGETNGQHDERERYLERRKGNEKARKQKKRTNERERATFRDNPFRVLEIALQTMEGSGAGGRVGGRVWTLICSYIQTRSHNTDSSHLTLTRPT